jgi:uncharacterized FAD-dependent dehydrogenase
VEGGKVKERDGIKEIEKVCRAVLKITDDDFSKMEEVIQSQEEYNHPLKMGTAHQQHLLSEHNRKVIDKLKELRTTIEAGAGIL